MKKKGILRWWCTWALNFFFLFHSPRSVCVWIHLFEQQQQVAPTNFQSSFTWIGHGSMPMMIRDANNNNNNNKKNKYHHHHPGKNFVCEKKWKKNISLDSIKILVKIRIYKNYTQLVEFLFSMVFFVVYLQW